MNPTLLAANPPSAPKVWTDEALLALPRERGRYELIDGKLCKKVSPPKPDHGVVAARLGAALTAFVDPRELGFVMVESGYRLDPANVLGPDVSFTSVERLRDRRGDGYLRGAPDLVVEIISPSERRAKIRLKLEKYFADGSRLIWHVFPRRRLVQVYTGPDEMMVRRLDASDDLDGGEVLPGFRVALATIFANLDWFTD